MAMAMAIVGRRIRSGEGRRSLREMGDWVDASSGRRGRVDVRVSYSSAAADGIVPRCGEGKRARKGCGAGTSASRESGVGVSEADIRRDVVS
jgi:hypothetical protein